MVIRVAAVVEQLWHKVPGGTARTTINTLSAFSADIDVVGLAANHRSIRRDDVYEQDLASVRGLRSVQHSRWPRPVMYERWLRSAAPSADFDLDDVAVVWAGAGICPPTKLPTVATVHDVDFLVHPDRLSRRGRNFFPRMWEVVQARADRIVCPSKVVADQCLAFGADASRVEVIPWGVELPDDVAKRESVWPRPVPRSLSREDSAIDREMLNNLGVEETYALWVGTREPRKNLRGLYEAFGQMPEIQLVVVGPQGWGSAHPNMMNPAGNLARVKDLGEVPESLLQVLYNSASVFVFPSHDEGFGLPVLEAMAHGVPVITSATTATAEVAGDAARLIDPKKPSEIADAVRQIIGDGTVAAAMRQSSLRQAKQMSWQSTAAAYSKIFHELVESPRSVMQ